MEPADLIVVAGGNLALIYFNVSKERMTLEEIEEAYPDLVEALANHPGIGVLMVRSAEHGLICVGKNGHPLPRRGPRRGRGPAGGLRRARRRRDQAPRRDRARGRSSRSSASSTRRPRRSRPSRSSSARTAAWAAPRRARSSSIQPTGSSTRGRSSGRRWSTGSCGPGWSGSSGMTFGLTKAAAQPAGSVPEQRAPMPAALAAGATSSSEPS